MLLERARIKRRHVVCAAVIRLRAVEREVHKRQPRPPAGHKRVQVRSGVAGQLPHHVVDVGKGSRLRHGVQRLAHDAALVGAGRIQERAALYAQPLQHDRETHILRPRVLAHKCRCADHTQFLAVGEQEDHVVPQRRACLDGAQCFQDCRYARAAVARPGRCGHRVVMPGEQHGFACPRRARQTHDHVLHRRHLRITRKRRQLAHGRALYLPFEAQLGDLRQQVVPHGGVGRRPNRVRLCRHHGQVLHGTRGREDVGRAVSRDTWRHAR